MVSRHQRPVLRAPGSRPTRPTRTGSLPGELLEAATKRLRIIGYLALIVSLIRLLVAAFANVENLFGDPREVTVKLAFFGAIAAVAAIAVALSHLRLPARRMLQVGAVFYVLMIVLTTATESTSAWEAQPFRRGIPLPVGIILTFPIVVPLPPRSYLIASFIGIAATPAVLLSVPLIVGIPPPDATIIAVNFLPLVIATAIATLIAKVIYQLGKDLGRAQRAGSYQLVAPLGKGGMGEVWRAKHGMLAREAAIKLIRGDRGDRGEAGMAEAVKRFEHEARVVASLRSQHTIELYDFGVTDDGALYYAMELLDGLDLDELVTRYGAQPPERVVHFLLQACHSLAEAHEAGMVHRDIKPANLFVTRLGRDYDVIKVLDFGLATKPVDEARKETRVTQEGVVVGTPAYMAPEQVMGDSGLDGRADLYNLGLVAWWALTGRDTFQATTSTQVMFAHVHAEPEPPSAHSALGVPPELDAVVLRCLQKRREDRPQTADELADELADALRKVGLEPWTQDRAIAWWRSIPDKSKDNVTEPEAIADTRASPSQVSFERDETLDA